MEGFCEQDLEAYLDEGLPAPRMAQIESALRADPELARRLAAINARRDAGEHTLGEIWRAGRVSCPTREELGMFLLGVLDDEKRTYIEFHAETVGCRYCQANLGDLRQRQVETAAVATSRRQKYFQSSAGYLRR